MISAIIKDKDMTPEHIETIIAVHNFSDVPRKKYRDAIDALRVDLYRMRQPITAEALREDGWAERWKWFLLDGRFRMFWSDDDNRWEFEVGRVSDSGTFMHGVIIASPSNMHDLRELVRLLGGAK